MRKKITIKNNAYEAKLFTRRTLVIAVAMAILILSLISRLIYLQAFEHNRYTTLSKENQLALIPVAPTRGLIYDRNNVLLAKNITVSSLDIIPDKVKNIKQTIARLNKIIPIDEDNLQDFFKLLKQKRRSEPVPLKLKLPEKEIDRFAVNQWRFPGVILNARLMRDYPLGSVMAPVLGYVGRINIAELAGVDPTNYSATNFIGKIGVEKYFEDQLHGTVGYQQVETDATGRIVHVTKEMPPVAGDNIYLTIDSRLQMAAAKAMGNEQGAVVVIQPKTGEVLALVSNPSYDPNLFVQGISSKAFNTLQKSKDRPLYNRAIRGLYAPGSTVKPFMGLEGLASGIITPEYKIYDPGWFKLKNSNHIYHNWLRSGFGWVNLKKAIILSDDTYFYNLAKLLGIKRINAALTAFGFSANTGIEMEEELPGVAPSPSWKLAHIGRSWYPGDTIITGIGQGFLLATPIQLAAGIASLAEHGKRLQPHLLLKMQSASGSMSQQPPIFLTSVQFPKSDWNLIINSMQKVITAKYGTGFRFGRDAPYSVAAKTGTAQLVAIKDRGKYTKDDLPEQLRDNSLFIAFAPVENPQIAVAVVVEHDIVAPIIARKVMDYYLLEEGKLKNVKSKTASRLG